MFGSDSWNTGNWNTTGSNWKDAMVGALSGFGQSGFGDSGKGNYYVKANWKGDGLADTGLGYMQNPNHKDLSSMAWGIAGQINNNRFNRNMPTIDNFDPSNDYLSGYNVLDKYNYNFGTPNTYSTLQHVLPQYSGINDDPYYNAQNNYGSKVYDLLGGNDYGNLSI